MRVIVIGQAMLRYTGIPGIRALDRSEHELDRCVRRNHVRPSATDGITHGVPPRELSYVIHAGDARRGAQRSRQSSKDGIRPRLRAGKRAAVHVHRGPIERNGRGIDASSPQGSPHFNHGRLHVIAHREALAALRHELGIRRDAMVGSKREHDGARVAQPIERIDERPQRAIEPKQVVVLLARVRTIAVTNVVRR